jgi:glycogen operon protein
MKLELKHKTQRKLSEGKPLLGATIEKNGINFAIYSEHAQEIFLLLFNQKDELPSDIIKIENKTDNIWHVFIHELSAGQLYGYKVRGENNPSQGKRFNEHKLLLDPYAKALTHKFQNTDNILLPYDSNSEQKDLVIDTRDNTHNVPKSIVIDNYYDWENVTSPNISLDEMVIYEVHVKGFTAHKTANVKHPGTYLGFIEKIHYLKELGVNAVELLPVQEFYNRSLLVNKGLNEYWGYNTIGFFAPELSYGTRQNSGCQVHEFKTLIKELHKAGIAVIMDVVYNHTGEGNELGPMLSFKGIDNSTYYALSGQGEEPFRYYVNDAGCGNILNIEHHQVLQLVLDSLKYWAEVFHVDGFRFDLGSILARVKGSYDKSSLFFEKIQSDPILSKLIMIAEPWDLTTYQVGNFPKNWAEWNGKYRDNIRKFIKGDLGQVKELSSRITGSSDLYGDDGRSPYHSINFVTCHDGFCLNDLVSYNEKHNEANLENNNDGANDNHSWNSGFEGETNDLKIIQLRKRLIKNHLCCLFLSSGTPMILGGDEFQRTQKGNNNTYCQDNDLSWYDWDLLKKNKDIYEFTRKLINIRKKYPILRTKIFLTGQDLDKDGVLDISWYNENINTPSWDDPDLKFICYQLDGSEAEEKKQNDYHIFIILNSDSLSHNISLPQYNSKEWFLLIDTYLNHPEDINLNENLIKIDPQNYYQCYERSCVVLLAKTVI